MKPPRASVVCSSVLVASGALLSLAETEARAHERGRDRYRNPTDTASYIASQEDPSRDAWQRPEQVLDALALSPGQTVCDIGSGPGYFSLRVARRVGESGRVFAVDVDPRILDALRTRIERARLGNITPVLGLASDPLLPPSTCDVILIVDVYHHFPDRPAYLRRLVRLLRPGARLINIDWHKRATAVGPTQEHRVSREEFLGDAVKAGLRLTTEPTFLPNHYFIIMSRPETK